MTGHTELDLETLTDEELNKLFATEIVGVKSWAPWLPPMFAADPNAVVAYLEKYTWSCDAETVGTERQVTVMVLHGEHSVAQGTAPTFARAAVIALLAAKRAPQNL
jgi:hypothetical protein